MAPKSWQPHAIPPCCWHRPAPPPIVPGLPGSQQRAQGPSLRARSRVQTCHPHSEQDTPWHFPSLQNHIKPLHISSLLPLQHYSPWTRSIASPPWTCVPTMAHPLALFHSTKPHHHEQRWPCRNPSHVLCLHHCHLPPHTHRHLPKKPPLGRVGSLGHSSSPLTPKPTPIRSGLCKD